MSLDCYDPIPPGVEIHEGQSRDFVCRDGETVGSIGSMAFPLEAWLHPPLAGKLGPVYGASWIDWQNEGHEVGPFDTPREALLALLDTPSAESGGEE